MSIMPSVAMNGGMPRIEMFVPLMSPMRPPKRIVAMTPAQSGHPQ